MVNGITSKKLMYISNYHQNYDDEMNASNDLIGEDEDDEQFDEVLNI